MATPPLTPRHEKRKLGELAAHPLQAKYFEDLSRSDLEVLAADIRKNGLRQLIEILPDNEAGLPPNTIICGHQRQKALLLNGETEAEVIVRHDLAQADAAAVEQAFLRDNQNRRHLDALARARVALRLFEIEKGRTLRRRDEGEARDRVGQVIGMSGRNLARYFRVLKAPVEVQDAFRHGKLSLVRAEKVADLDAKTRAEIATRIRAGEAPMDVLAAHLADGDGRHRKPADALACFVRGLLRGAHDLEDRIDSVPARMLEVARPALEKGANLITELLARACSTKTGGRGRWREEEE